VIRDQRRETRELERRLDLFGTSVRVLVGGPASEGAPSPDLAAAVAQAVLQSCQAELTRFDPGSELSRLNADPAPARVTSKLVAGAIAAAIGAAERSGGLVPMGTEEGTTKVVLLPLMLDGRRLGVQRPLPRVGEHTEEVLGALKEAAR